MDKNKFLTLRRAILNDEFSYLNPEQKKGVFYCGSPLLILAGAGSVLASITVPLVSPALAWADDTADAVAAAICHGHSGAGRRRKLTIREGI